MEYEQNGEDRAEYGAKLLPNLATKLKHIKGLDERSLRSMRKFYQSYTYLNEMIWGTVPPKLQNLLIRGTASPKFIEEQVSSQKVWSPTPLSENKLKVPANVLISKLSYSHLELLLNISEPLKRTFYEMECIK